MDPMGHEFIKATTTANDLIPSNRTNLEILCSKFESVDVLNMSLHRQPSFTDVQSQVSEWLLSMDSWIIHLLKHVIYWGL